ncbi:MAG: hypothetical protein IPL43_04270 [Micropruina sp.]|nr:hypothetical protein [Micropruina sp.]
MDVIARTAPAGSAQAMLSTVNVAGAPVCSGKTGGVPVAANTRPVEQANAPWALRRRPVTVEVSSPATGSPPARIRFFTARQSRPGERAFSNAATPVTCGAAMEVPLAR